ncbi:hypothetical protein GQ53DRAFT_217716 [Thozetella sp. PMI_491]|nr:hypothetical protein GQ53DRAFT_217716 [Thozetella sp. PMI_491]
MKEGELYWLGGARTQRSFWNRFSIFVLLACASIPPSVHASQQPFLPAETARSLVKRQSGCIANTFSCSNLGSAFNGICCVNGQTCALDASNSPACCPSGAVCTGVAPASFVAPTATVASFVQNPYFPFPYIAGTSFANAAQCSSAYSQCTQNYAACTSELGGGSGGAFGVTIIVPGGGGTTVTGGAANLGSSSAAGICTSLSSVACSGLQQSVCTAGSGGGFFVGTANAAARPTAACGGALVAAGVAGLGLMHVL